MSERTFNDLLIHFSLNKMRCLVLIMKEKKKYLYIYFLYVFAFLENEEIKFKNTFMGNKIHYSTKRQNF